MQFIQDIINQLGAFFNDNLGGSFESIINAIVEFVNNIIGKEANF